MLGRLFQGLEERIERLLGEHVHFVDDVDLHPRPAGPNGDVLAKLTDFVDAAIAGTVNFQHVDIIPRGNRLADFALVARCGSGTVFAVERLGKNPRRGGLANPTGTRKQIGVPNAVARNSPLQGLGHMLLANELVKPLRPIPPRDDDIVGSRFSVGYATRIVA
jgi:hypothetical protein